MNGGLPKEQQRRAVIVQRCNGTSGIIWQQAESGEGGREEEGKEKVKSLSLGRRMGGVATSGYGEDSFRGREEGLQPWSQ